jgi:hypothetical protein
MENYTNKELLNEIRLTRKAIEKSGSYTPKFTFIVLFFTIIQILIALFQFILATQTSGINPLFGILLVVILIGVILVLMKVFDKEIDSFKKDTKI